MILLSTSCEQIEKLTFDFWCVLCSRHIFLRVTLSCFISSCFDPSHSYSFTFNPCTYQSDWIKSRLKHSEHCPAAGWDISSIRKQLNTSPKKLLKEINLLIMPILARCSQCKLLLFTCNQAQGYKIDFLWIPSLSINQMHDTNLLNVEEEQNHFLYRSPSDD